MLANKVQKSLGMDENTKKTVEEDVVELEDGREK